MRKRETIIYTFIIFACALASQFISTHVQAQPKILQSTDEAKLAALVASMGDTPFHLDTVIKDSSCSVQGPLPDHACTPGAVFRNAATSTICTSGYTKTVRDVPSSVKKQVYANYGIPYPEPSGSYELDHLVPLEIGGSNAIANLFPEAASPTPGFHEKDVVENYLHEQVCSGALSLSVAQEQIADNWVAVYDLLSTSTIDRLKAKYRNWADPLN
jgi:hypothetical protein